MSENIIIDKEPKNKYIEISSSKYEYLENSISDEIIKNSLCNGSRKCTEEEASLICDNLKTCIGITSIDKEIFGEKTWKILSSNPDLYFKTNINSKEHNISKYLDNNIKNIYKNNVVKIKKNINWNDFDKRINKVENLDIFKDKCKFSLIKEALNNQINKTSKFISNLFNDTVYYRRYKDELINFIDNEIKNGTLKKIKKSFINQLENILNKNNYNYTLFKNIKEIDYLLENKKNNISLMKNLNLFLDKVIDLIKFIFYSKQDESNEFDLDSNNDYLNSNIIKKINNLNKNL